MRLETIFSENEFGIDEMDDGNMEFADEQGKKT